MGKNILICDFDGTLIKQNIENQFLSYLRKHHKLGIQNYLLALLTIPVNGLRRLVGKGNLMKSWSCGKSRHQVNQLIEAFLEENIQNIEEIQTTLDFVQNFEGKRLLLTGSYEPLVKRYLEKKEIFHIFDKIVGSDISKNGFKVVKHPFGVHKKQYVKTDWNSVGIGNEHYDRYFLEKCSQAYVVNPDQKLYALAVRNGWKELK